DRLAAGNGEALTRHGDRQRVRARAELLAAGTMTCHGQQGRSAHPKSYPAAQASALPGQLPIAHRSLLSFRPRRLSSADRGAGQTRRNRGKWRAYLIIGGDRDVNIPENRSKEWPHMKSSAATLRSLPSM